jgi:hypothetical protein
MPWSVVRMSVPVSIHVDSCGLIEAEHATRSREAFGHRLCAPDPDVDTIGHIRP